MDVSPIQHVTNIFVFVVGLVVRFCLVVIVGTAIRNFYHEASKMVDTVRGLRPGGAFRH